MVVTGAALAGFAGLGALTGVVFRAVFTKRRYGLERIVSFRLLALAVFLVWMFLPFLYAVIDTGEYVTSDEQFVILTFALPVALIAGAWTYRRRVTPRVITREMGAPIVHAAAADLRAMQPEQRSLPARTLPTPF